MQFAPALQLAAAAFGQTGFSASFGATVDHDAAPGTLGSLRVFSAEGPVSLPDGNLAGSPGSAGGRFDVTGTGTGIRIDFGRDGLGTGFAEGEAVSTEISVPVTDTQTTVDASIRITVHRPFTPPGLAGPIPDRTDTVVLAPVKMASIPDLVTAGPSGPVLLFSIPDQTDPIT